ncbi:MAG: tRNA 2-thiouridine(34) synthase MnmA [bacterium]|nr:tRNA 2-thiouridine(34) synthase MnmA [bacterium]
MKKKGNKVFVAMSGGVDSSVAAALLIKQGYDVIGAHMKCFNVDGCAERDAEDARRVAEQLKIPFYVFDFEKEYKERVVDYMIKGYKSGITPNPDVMCNKEIKFGLFFEKARKLGADFVATGHYVRLRRTTIDKKQLTIDKTGQAVGQMSNVKCQMSLCTARDLNKDQSYFLWTLTQKQLAHCLFPIGEYTKPRVRVLAKKFGLLTAVKKDSQGICFLGQVSIRDFLKQYIKPKKGNVLLAPAVIPANAGIQKRQGPAKMDSGSEAGMTSQRVVGTHEGAHLYTIGQRHGFGVGGLATPHYVISKDLKKNTITIAPENHPSLYQKEITLTEVNFIRPSQMSKVNGQMSVMARVRYRQPLASAMFYKLKAKSYKLVFDKPQKFVAAGQSAVFYDVRGEMLGGGIIVV